MKSNVLETTFHIHGLNEPVKMPILSEWINFIHLMFMRHLKHKDINIKNKRIEIYWICKY